MRRWQDSDPEYHAHLATVYSGAVANAAVGDLPATRLLRRWHREVLGPVSDSMAVVGKIRQNHFTNPDLRVDVDVGGHRGVPFEFVPRAMERFDADLNLRAQQLDTGWSTMAAPERLRRASGLAAWVHGQIVRIHPFVDANGRIARLAASCILRRYGYLYALSSRPRPAGDYGACASASMTDDHAPMEQYLVRAVLLDEMARKARQSSPPAA